MDDKRLPNLLFLASMASLAMPGCDGKGSDTGGGPNASPKGNPLDDDNSLTDGSPDEPGTAPSPGDRPGATGGGGASRICDSYLGKILECGEGGEGYYEDYGLDVYGMECEALLESASQYGGPGCRSALEDWLVCLSQQPCDALVCPNQEAAVDAACDVDEPEPVPETGGDETGFPDGGESTGFGDTGGSTG